MNIFEYHLTEIHNLLEANKKTLNLDKIDNFKNVNLEVPPEKFNFDLSFSIFTFIIFISKFICSFNFSKN